VGNKDDHAGADGAKAAEKNAGVVNPKVARLPRDPAPYAVRPREEPGPEALPPAVTEREFQPITDVGTPTEAPEEHQRRGKEKAQ
jgi:hypothetical protein